MTGARLFLLEVHVNAITFKPDYHHVPKKEDLSINIKFGDIMNINIDPADFATTNEVQLHQNIIDVNMGKTYLFPSEQKRLQDSLKSNPLEVAVNNGKAVECICLVPWRAEFIDIVKTAMTVGTIRAEKLEGAVPLTNSKDEVLGGLDMILRLTCFGNNIETAYKENPEGGFEFLNSKTKCKYTCIKQSGTGDPITCAPIHAPLTNTIGGAGQLSWTELFGGAVCLRPSAFSTAPDGVAENRSLGGNLVEILAQSSAYDIVSMVFRPQENKFYDLANIEKEKPQEPESLSDGDLAPAAYKRPVKDDQLMLTSEKIEEQLCQNRDCPAVIKFKDYGIGPLATGKALGTLYGDVEPPCVYGLSNTYGSMEKYGPYGVFSRPKRAELPFQPKEPPPEDLPRLERKCPGAQTQKKTKLCCSCYQRMRDGGCNGMKGGCCHVVTRRLTLRGGGGGTCNNDPPVLRLRGGGSGELRSTLSTEPKSPFQECKSVMDQFDSVLAAYRKALGPCGEATCPYAQSMAEENCRKVCEMGVKPPSQVLSVSCSEVPCPNVDCPYQEPTKFDIPGGCRSAKCAYTKYKLGLVDDDALLELSCLPPAISGKCGHPRCPYPLPPELPPVHWDCPEPLPKGACKNPNCPHQPPNLRRIKCPPPRPGPCGKVTCPYAFPEPCNLPSCPFKPRPCPFLEAEERSRRQTERKSLGEQEGPTTCENPECPFAQASQREVDPVESDPRYKGEFETCANPSCPFAKPKKDKKAYCGNPQCAFKPEEETCPNPDCPFAPPPKCPFAPKNDDSCGNPKCPFATPETNKNKDEDYCGNPDCPFAGQDKREEEEDYCGNPSCPFAPSQEKKNANGDYCGNPNCPFSPQNAPEDETPTRDEFCGNPDCPFAPKKSGDEYCGNPSCPFAPKKKEDETCGNPFCPFSRNVPGPTKSKPGGDVCSNPQCPFASKSNGGDCTSASKNSEESFCGNPACPYNPDAQKDKEDETCDNPECPAKLAKQKEESAICDNPDCPSNRRTSECFKPCEEEETKKTCDYPDCPSNRDKKLTCADNDDVCDNPNCPYGNHKQNGYVCRDPFCVYAQPLPSCGIPNCPFEPKPLILCPSVNCPSNKSLAKLIFQRQDCNRDEDSKPCDGDRDNQKSSSRFDDTDGGRVCGNDDCLDKADLAPQSSGKLKGSASMGKGLSKGRLVDAGGDRRGSGDGDEQETGRGKGRKKKTRFEYGVGDRYPGVQVGHKDCVMPLFNVPPKMGWLWNVSSPYSKPLRGWRPGAIMKTIARRIRAHRQAKGLGYFRPPKFRKKFGEEDSGDEIKVKPRPTLQIKKKDGIYHITMNPLKDPYTLVENEDPYMECTPMQFKITKKKKDGEDDENKCTCEEEEITSSSDSELDIEFTPPAGIIHPERFVKKKNVAHTDTQYNPQDFAVAKEKGKGKKGKGKDKGKGKGGKGKKKK